DFVRRGGERLGMYFAETGASQRASAVVYDRAHSALSEIEPRDLRWQEILHGAAWFHTSGITPALGPGAADCTRAALAAAREAGVLVSVDLNYRGKLWTEADAQRVMRPLMGQVHLLIANEEDLQSTLGLSIPHADVTKGRLDIEAYRAAAERVVAEHGVKQ